MPSAIEDYGLIGDCETAALVSRNGSIDWLCLPRFDSPACFAALLGSPENGRWLLAPRAGATVTRRYRPHTLVLETKFKTARGQVTVIDFMPVRESTQVCRFGFNGDLGSFVQHYGTKEVDASLLLLPLVGFLPPCDPRIVGTVRAIEQQLMRDGLVLRYRTRTHGTLMKLGEGAFLPCSFWLADYYKLAGRHQDAENVLKRLLAIRNDLGLLAEEYDVRSRQMVGNFPQALSHVALVNTIINLYSRRGPVHQRAGDQRKTPAS